MDVLFIHQNFPAQYRHLAAALVKRGDRPTAIGGPTARSLPGVPLHRYDPLPKTGIPHCHPWASDLQTKCLRAQAVGVLLEHLLREGLCPDLVVGHPGWGELLAIKDLLPGVPVLHQVEFVYQLQGADVGFDADVDSVLPDDCSRWQERTRQRLRRAPQLLAFHDLDWGIAPTQWQASTAPEEFRPRLSVIHEGIDTNLIKPNPEASISLARAGITFRPGDELVSFVARNLEPYRGFHRFMRMLPQLQKLRPKAHVVIVGAEGQSYGSAPAGGGSWRQKLLAELEGRLDLSRIHFVGQVSSSVLHDLFNVCRCHVYLTVPFVLSWSVLDAMACGAIVVGSSTPPVEEVIEHGRNGLLVDFFDADQLAGTIAAVLSEPDRHQHLGLAARETVCQRFDLSTICLPAQMALVKTLAEGGDPAALGTIRS